MITSQHKTEALRLIERSISHTEIAHADYSDDLAEAIRTLDEVEAARWEASEGSECTPWIIGLEDSVDTGNRVEFWGMDGDGNEWRVHLDRE